MLRMLFAGLLLRPSLTPGQGSPGSREIHLQPVPRPPGHWGSCAGSFTPLPSSGPEAPWKAGTPQAPEGAAGPVSDSGSCFDIGLLFASVCCFGQEGFAMRHACLPKQAPRSSSIPRLVRKEAQAASCSPSLRLGRSGRTGSD